MFFQYHSRNRSPARTTPRSSYVLVFVQTLIVFAVCILTTGLVMKTWYNPSPVALADSTLMVNDAGDDLTPGNGACTLREALANANSDAATYPECGAGTGTDTIQFDPNLNGQTIALSSALVIDSNLMIEGPGADNLTISGGNSAIVFSINPASGSPPTVAISGLTIANGNRGIFNNGILTVRDTTVRDGTATDGAGIFSVRPLTVTNSIIRNNTASDSGGGIRSIGGALTISNTTISGNAANTGGGISLLGSTVDISSTTIVDNSATSLGGGLFSNQATVTVSNSTISGNQANIGGGIQNGGPMVDNEGTLTVLASTVSSNVATAWGGGISSFGTAPGIY